MKKKSLYIFLLSAFLISSAALAGKIHKSAIKGDTRKVEKILDKTPEEANAKDEAGNCPLHIAAEYGHDEIVKVLLAKGADVNAIGKNGNTPLNVAAKMGKLEIAQILLSNGADIAAEDTKGLSPLQAALILERWDVALLLLQKGADAKKPDLNGWTPLHFAAKYGRVKLAEELIGKGVDINAKNNEGRTPLQLTSCSLKHGMALKEVEDCVGSLSIFADPCGMSNGPLTLKTNSGEFGFDRSCRLTSWPKTIPTVINTPDQKAAAELLIKNGATK